MLLVGVALLIALVDWWSVGRDRAPIEYAAKPMVMVVLIAAVLGSGEADSTVTGLIVTAFAFSLVGDVVLMLPRGPFEGGLGAFLVAHLFTIAALLHHGMRAGWLALGIVVVGAAAAVLAPPIVRHAAARQRVLGAAVAVYVAVLAAMAAIAVGVGHWATVGAGLLFMTSDALLGWGRFVGPTPGGRVAVHATYHLAQAGFATWLIVG